MSFLDLLVRLLLLLWLTVVGVSAQQVPNADSSDSYVAVCDPDDFALNPDDPPLPTFPDQFSYTIEGNLLGNNRTVIITEYYDAIGNRGRIDFGRNDSTVTKAIFDYNLAEVFVIPDALGGECRVYTIDDDARFLNFSFGIAHVNDSIRIGSTSRYIEQIADDTRVRYEGESTVRGIPTQSWSACTSRENNSFVIEYYFVKAEEWDYQGQDKNLDSDMQMVPVQIILDDSRIDNDTVKNAYNIYSVVDFRAGPNSVPDSVFKIPDGIACKGRLPGQSVPQIPEYFSTYVQQVSQSSQQTFVQTVKEYYDFPNNLLRVDVFYDGSNGGSPGPLTIIHDFSTSVQYIINSQFLTCYPMPLASGVPYFSDITTDENGDLRLRSPNNLFFIGNEFNYSYEGVLFRGVQVDSWVSVRDFVKITPAINLSNSVYEVFFTRPGLVRTTSDSISTEPVPWGFKLRGTLMFFNVTDNSTVTQNITYEGDFFDFSTSEPTYDAFDISLCSAPDDYYTLVLIIPGREAGLDVTQLKRNIRGSVANYTGVRPLQIGNIQIVRDNGSHIFVTFHISNLTSIALIDNSTNVTANWAVDYIMNNTVGSQLPFQIQLSSNSTVTPSIHGVGRGPRNNCNQTVCNCTAPIFPCPMSNPNCTAPDQPPRIPKYFSTRVHDVDVQSSPPIILSTKRYYDFPNKLYRLDAYINSSRLGPPGPYTIIHDFNTSTQYVLSNREVLCIAVPLSKYASYYPDIVPTDSEEERPQLVSPDNLFLLGSEFNYTYEGVSNLRGVDVDSWVSVRDFEQITSRISISDFVYRVYFTRPEWLYVTDSTVTREPVPWRIVVNGTISIFNSTDNSTNSFNATYEVDYYDFSTEEPAIDSFDVSMCAAPEDYYTLIMLIPGRRDEVEVPLLRSSIRNNVINYTGIRPLQIGNIQITHDNGTHIFVIFQLANLTEIATVSPDSIVTASTALQKILDNTVDSILPFQVNISSNTSVYPSLHVAGRGPRNSSNSNSTCNCSIPTCPTYNSSNSNSTCNCPIPTCPTYNCLSDTTIAGIAIALFLIGLFLGILSMLICVCVLRCCCGNKGASVNIGESIKYKKQEDDLYIT